MFLFSRLANSINDLLSQNGVVSNPRYIDSCTIPKMPLVIERAVIYTVAPTCLLTMRYADYNNHLSPEYNSK